MNRREQVFAAAARFAKTAEPQLSTDDQIRQENQGRMLGDMGHMGMAALGVGVGARGLVGLYNMLKRNISPTRVNYPGAIMTSIPVPVGPSEDEDKRKRKFASDGSAWNPMTYIHKGLDMLPGQTPSAASSKSGFQLMGDGPVTNYQNDWRYPMGMMAAGGLGLYGGWKGVDALLNRRRKSDTDSEMEDARGDFEKAMLESYAKPRKPSGFAAPEKVAQDKTAGEKLGEVLDQLYDKLQPQLSKTADWTMFSPDTVQRMGGAYLGYYALPTAALTGKILYDKAKKTNQATALQKAMGRRLRQQYTNQPSEIMAVPREVPTADSEFEEGGGADQDATKSVDAPELSAVGPRKISRGIL
jgi:hypothetical protein